MNLLEILAFVGIVLVIVPQLFYALLWLYVCIFGLEKIMFRDGGD